MQSLTTFRSIEDLVNLLNKERQLLGEMFAKRKLMQFRTDLAREMVQYKEERIRRLIDYNVIHESGNFLEMESVYLEFFEEVLDVNDEISVASVKECIDSITETIGYYLKENNEQRKYGYQRDVRQLMRKTSLKTLRNVVDLKRNVENAYKQEPNYEIKKAKLQNLDNKSKAIKELIDQCERLIEKESIFFEFKSDNDMHQTIEDVKLDFVESYHNLLEIDKQIILYLNKIDLQNLFNKKLRRLKYLKDQLTWREDTNVAQIFEEKNPVWTENRQYQRIRLSIEMMRNSEEMAQLIRKIASRKGLQASSRNKAEPLSLEEMAAHVEETFAVDTYEVWNAFRASGRDLLSFVEQYDYGVERPFEEHIKLFCQLVALNIDDLRLPFNYAVKNDFEYPLIYPR